MEKLDEFKKNWGNQGEEPVAYDEDSMKKLVKTRAGKHIRTSLMYFWPSFALQILVYSMLSHVIIKYWSDVFTILPAVAGIAIFIPFTVALLTKFKKLATMHPQGNEMSSVREYVLRQRNLLQSFYTFKKRYELLLIPLGTSIGVLLTFKLYVPGGPYAYPSGVLTCLIISLASCYYAIRLENKKHFSGPIGELSGILDEYYTD